MTKPNMIDFIRESAAYMVADRPDLYDHDSAVIALSNTIDTMRDIPGSGMTSFADFIMIRFVDEDMEEWDLVRKLSSVVNYNDGDMGVFSHTHESEVLRVGVDLPTVDEYYESEDEED